MAQNNFQGNADSHKDVVLSTRVRLVRNLDSVPFPVRLNTLRRQEINSGIIRAVKRAELPLNVIDMSTLYPFETVSLAERHLISPEFASSTEGRMLLLSPDEKISIMLCERDHIRIQCTESGLGVRAAYENAVKVADTIGSFFSYAFDSGLGFLSQNPKDLGTGMRPSVLMHLPALSRTGVMTRISATASKLGISVRGSYGDAASVKGDLFRISNTVTMGISEEEALDNLKTIVLQIATRERTAAEEYISDISIKDRINRSAGLIRNAVLLTEDEMTELLSWVRLGALYGIVEADTELINRMFSSMQPATINVLAKQKLPDSVKDEIRARTVKQIFPE